jgi:hypothetical protein
MKFGPKHRTRLILSKAAFMEGGGSSRPPRVGGKRSRGEEEEGGPSGGEKKQRIPTQKEYHAIVDSTKAVPALALSSALSKPNNKNKVVFWVFFEDEKWDKIHDGELLKCLVP